MGVRLLRNKEAGFAALEGVLLVVVIATIVGVGAYVIHSKHTAEKTLGATSTTSGGNAPQGTTASVDQITEQDAKTETGVDNGADSSMQQDATSSNTAVNSLGGAYNEASY